MMQVLGQLKQTLASTATNIAPAMASAYTYRSFIIQHAISTMLFIINFIIKFNGQFLLTLFLIQ